MRPPCSSTSRLVMGRPSPVPSRMPAAPAWWKRFEDRGVLFRRNAYPRIAHRDPRQSIGSRNVHLDAPARRRELNRITQQVVKDLLDAQTVAVDKYGTSHAGPDLQRLIETLRTD